MNLLSALRGALSSLVLAAALAAAPSPALAQSAYEAALPPELGTSPALCDYVPCAEVLPGAQDVFDATTKGFTLGKFSFLETLDAQRTLLAARAQYLRALSQTHRAAAELERLLGAQADAGSGPTRDVINERLP